MRVLLALTYYRPHVSGLTIYVSRLAEALAARGHEVTVLTSRYSLDLARTERARGVRVVRVPVVARLSKGAIMPAYLRHALPLLRWCETAVVNLPSTPAEALLLPLAARLAPRRPVVATYHCDVLLPPGVGNWLITRGVLLANLLSGCLVRRLVAYTDDYASHSRVLRRYPAKRVVIPPPVVAGAPDPEKVAAVRREHAPDGAPLVGFVARFASEKGVEVMLRALPALRARLGEARVLFAGEHRTVIGEGDYWRRLQPALAEAAGAWRFLGVVPPEELPHLYAACDVTVLPSLNSTESFGLVQVESMLCGTPVVTSELPGVREPVRLTGMGRTVPPGDAGALAEALCDVITHPERYRKAREEIERHYSLARTVAGYEALFGALSAPRDRGEAGRGVR